MFIINKYYLAKLNLKKQIYTKLCNFLQVFWIYLAIIKVEILLIAIVKRRSKIFIDINIKIRVNKAKISTIVYYIILVLFLI